jgi:toxin ParE1/3/4
VPRKALILDAAKSDYKAIKQHVKREFGDACWETSHKAFLDALDHIKQSPEMGLDLDELKFLGITAFRSKLVNQTRIIYEFDDANIIIHMFIHTRRDFTSHLLNRVLGT